LTRWSNKKIRWTIYWWTKDTEMECETKIRSDADCGSNHQKFG